MTKIFDKNSIIKDRLIQVADYYSISIRKFEEKCQLGRGIISNATGAIGSDKLSKIADNCVEINLEWLLTGNGEMLKSEVKASNCLMPESEIVQLLLDQIAGLKRESDLKDVIILEKERYIQDLLARLNGNFLPKTGTE